MSRPSDRPVVLDGGLSNALEDRGHDLSDALWSARLLRDAPAEIAAVHRSYYQAGAMVATTASYQASVVGFERAGVDRHEAERLITSSVRIARDVRDEFPGRLIAASVGPYGAMLADGSEYRGRYGRSVRELTAFHRPRIEVLAAARPDVLALETVPDADEAEAMLRAAEGCGVPVWLSYTVEGDRTRAGQPLAEAFAVAAGRPGVVAVGVNCCDPGDVLHAVRTAVAVTGLPAVAYPNSGERWDPAARRWTGTYAFAPDAAPGMALGWRAAGARLIGGCCRVGPATVAALARALHGGGPGASSAR